MSIETLTQVSSNDSDTTANSREIFLRPVALSENVVAEPETGYFDATMPFLYSTPTGQTPGIHVSNLMTRYNQDIASPRKGKKSSASKIDRTTFPLTICHRTRPDGSILRTTSTTWEVCDIRNDGSSWHVMVSDRKGFPKKWNDIFIQRPFAGRDEERVASRALIGVSNNDLITVSSHSSRGTIHLIYRIVDILPWPAACAWQPSENNNASHNGRRNEYCAANVELIAIRSQARLSQDILGWELETSEEKLPGVIDIVQRIVRHTQCAMLRKDSAISYVEHFSLKRSRDTARNAGKAKVFTLEAETDDITTTTPEDFVFTVQKRLAAHRDRLLRSDDGNNRHMIIPCAVTNTLNEPTEDAVRSITVSVEVPDALSEDGGGFIIQTVLTEDAEIPLAFEREPNLIYMEFDFVKLYEKVSDESVEDRKRKMVATV